MKRMVICTFACHLLLASIATAQDNPLKTIWPFGKGKKSTTNAAFDNINPFTSPTRPAKDDKLFGLPSPTKLIGKAGQTTDSMVQKTRKTWKGFGKSLNPFAAKSKPKSTSKRTSKSKPKQSMLGRLLPKQKKTQSPTMGEFLSMKRPGF